MQKWRFQKRSVPPFPERHRRRYYRIGSEQTVLRAFLGCADPGLSSVPQGAPARKPYGLYVGRLDPDKNIRRIIEFGLQCPYVETFIVAGDGVLRSYVEKAAQKNNKLLYVGRQKKVEDYYGLCTFLIHLPDHDPHPTTTMEAALGGCFPIISTGVGTRYLFDGLFIVNDPSNFAEINERIKHIVENEAEARRLLGKDASRIPTKEKALAVFREAFFELVNEIQ